jgi:O-antigen/teichoic acid export membrane protein
VAVPIGIAGFLLSGPALRLVFGEQYLSSVRVLQILSWMVFPLVFDQILPQACFAAGRSLAPVVGQAVMNAARVGLAVGLVTWFGERAAEGLAWALVTTGVACFVVYTGLIRRYICGFAPGGALARTALAAVAPAALIFVLDDRVNVILLTATALAAFAAGACVFGVFTKREIEIVRRAVTGFRTRIDA